MHKAWSSIEKVLCCFSRSSIKFQVTWDKTSILIQIGNIWTVTPVRIQWWLWNDAQSLKQHRTSALSFFNVICQISWSHGTKKITEFDAICGFPDCSLNKFEFTNGVKIMCKVQYSAEVVPYSYSRCSIKFQGHRGQKIADFDPNWALPDCSLSLNSTMALKWCTKFNV